MIIDMESSQGEAIIQIIERDMGERSKENFRWSQQDEAKRLKIEYSTLNKWLVRRRIERMDIDNIVKLLNSPLGPEIARHLKISIPNE